MTEKTLASDTIRSCGWPSPCTISIGIFLVSDKIDSLSSISESGSPRRDTEDLFVGLGDFGGLKVQNRFKFSSKTLLASLSIAA